MIDVSLLQPATNPQLRQFTRRLDRVAYKLSGNVSEFDYLEFNTRIGHGDSEIWRFGFSYYGEEDMDGYEINVSSAVPVSKDSGPSNVIKVLNDYRGYDYDQDDIEEINQSLSDKYGEEIDIGQETEGYLELQTKLSIYKVIRGPIRAAFKSMVNILDEDLNEADCELGFALDVFDIGKEELHLIGDCPVSFDVGMRERELVVPTCADLILATRGIIKAGLLPNSAKAYTHAPMQ